METLRYIYCPQITQIPTDYKTKSGRGFSAQSVSWWLILYN